MYKSYESYTKPRPYRRIQGKISPPKNQSRARVEKWTSKRELISWQIAADSQKIVSHYLTRA